MSDQAGHLHLRINEDGRPPTSDGMGWPFLHGIMALLQHYTITFLQATIIILLSQCIVTLAGGHVQCKVMRLSTSTFESRCPPPHSKVVRLTMLHANITLRFWVQSKHVIMY